MLRRENDKYEWVFISDANVNFASDIIYKPTIKNAIRYGEYIFVQQCYGFGNLNNNLFVADISSGNTLRLALDKLINKRMVSFEIDQNKKELKIIFYDGTSNSFMLENLLNQFSEETDTLPK